MIVPTFIMLLAAALNNQTTNLLRSTKGNFVIFYFMNNYFLHPRVRYPIRFESSGGTALFERKKSP